ncbi:MAG: nucleotidyltransferase domain-containing protein [Nanoarchaeota archaeon]|nr:nucleotidyltransferase domain-containing protein [Nanoarchaeota archaeon]
MKEIQRKVVPLLKKYCVVRAGIFGSYARGEQKKKSDLDILVEIKKNLSLLDVVGLQLDLQKKLKKKVDLVEYKMVKPLIKKEILQEEVKIL